MLKGNEHGQGMLFGNKIGAFVLFRCNIGMRHARQRQDSWVYKISCWYGLGIEVAKQNNVFSSQYRVQENATAKHL